MRTLLTIVAVATLLGPVSAGAGADAANTDRNERDRQGDTLTPMDQGNSEGDLSITQKIRQELVASDKLSMNAKNIKVITRDAVVTLRGPVKTDAEKGAIASFAQQTAGVKRVDNQLEVEKEVR